MKCSHPTTRMESQARVRQAHASRLLPRTSRILKGEGCMGVFTTSGSMFLLWCCIPRRIPLPSLHVSIKRTRARSKAQRKHFQLTPHISCGNDPSHRSTPPTPATTSTSDTSWSPSTAPRSPSTPSSGPSGTSAAAAICSTSYTWRLRVTW